MRTPQLSSSYVAPTSAALILGIALLFAGCSRQSPVSAKTVSTPITSADWAVFRGDASLAGVAAGALPARLGLRWSAKAGDGIKSSPVIAAGRVFIGAGDAVVALDLADGKPAWRFKAAAGVEAPPLFRDGVIFVGSLDGTLYALDASTGARRWTYKAEDKIAGSANFFAVPDGKGQRIIVGSYDTAMHCVDAATGTLVWKHETKNYINGAPAVGDGTIVFGGCDGKLHLLALDGQALGEVDAGAYVAGSIALAGNQAFFGQYGNKVLCIDLPGKTVVWSYGDEKDGAPFLSSPAVAVDRLVIGGRDGAVHCLSREDGRRLWIFRTGGDVDSSPVICGDKVLVGSADGRLYLLKLADGARLWSYEIGAPVNTCPAVGGGLVVVGADDGTVYAFGAVP